MRSGIPLSFTLKGDTGKPLSHIAIPSGEGIKIFDLWESEEVLGDFAQNPRFHQVLQETGLPEPEVEVTSVHAATGREQNYSGKSESSSAAQSS